MGVPPFLICDHDTMKLLTAQQIRECDAYTIAHEPIASIDLMERASKAFVEAFLASDSQKSKQVSIFCGTGNNGGDGLVIARLLVEQGWDVDCFLVQFSDNVSDDNLINQNRLLNSGIPLQMITSKEDFPNTIHSVIIDALVGTGIKRPLEGLLAHVVQKINQQAATIYSVDLPSGLYDSGDCSAHLNGIVHANFTFTFQAPKLNFLLSEYANIIGVWNVLDIGLDQDFIDALPAQEFLLSREKIQALIQPRPLHSHKGTFGHAGLVCGSKGMMGAAVLATSACLRSGAGLTTAMVPDNRYSILQTTCPEAMCVTIGKEEIDALPELGKYSAIGIGPGIGQSKATEKVLLELISSANVPLIIDADALNLLSEAELAKLPKNSIITPHPKEFERLFGTSKNSHDRLDLLRLKSIQHNVIILLKGHHSCIALPNGNLYFNTTGNPGMAKGGSGDVLTGFLTGLLARGYTSEDAAMLACYVHGFSGDLCANEIGMEGMTAGDLISFLPAAIQEVTYE